MTNINRKSPLFVVALILLSINLRAAIVAFGPIVTPVQNVIHTTPTVIGIIGALPIIAFGVGSPFAAKLAQKFGLENILLVGTILMTAGGVLRVLLPNPYTVMAGTFILSLGIALANVLIAAAIRRDRPEKIERMSGLQMFSFSVTAAIAAGIVVPIEQHFGWQWALGIWSLLPIPAFFAWLKIRAQHRQSDLQEQPPSDLNIWKSKLAWAISLYCGFQSMVFYTLVNWLPTLISERGFTFQEAGFYNMVFQLVALPTVVIVTPIAERYSKMGVLMGAAAIAVIIGMAAVWYAPTSLMLLWVIVLGAGACATFTFCLMLFAMRGKDSAESASLSGMAQTVGYCIAAFGPFLAGWLFELTQGWKTPVYALFGVMVLVAVLGFIAGREGEL